MNQISSQLSDKPATLEMISYYTQTRFGSLHHVGPKKRRSREVMLFIHGFGSSWKVWTPLIQSVKKQSLLMNTDFLIVDLPSFGKSENKLNHLKSFEIGAELIKLCKQHGYSRIRVTGHSMGGFLALDLAAKYPGVLSVHLIAGTYFRLLRVANNPLKEIFSSPRLTIYYLFQTAISRSGFLTFLANKAYKYLLSRKHKAFYEISGQSFLYASRNGVDYDTTKLWGSLKMPVRGVFGSRDTLVSGQDMRELQKILPESKLTAIEGGTHSVLITHPDQVASALY